jgi:UDP-N-acetylglucosamine diphosphorylase/glucosamine-1-phosphate N-acetyltransferase
MFLKNELKVIMKKIVLFEDHHYNSLLPLTYFKHASELRVGVFSIEEKWQNLGYEVIKIGKKYLENDYEAAENISFWVNSRFVPDQKSIEKILTLGEDECFKHANFIVALNSTIEKTFDEDGYLDEQSISSLKVNFIGHANILEYPWDIQKYNDKEIKYDKQFVSFPQKEKHSASLINPKHVIIHENADIQPGVVLNAHNGAVVIDENAFIGANSIIEGPAYIGKNTHVRPLTSIRGSSIHHFSKAGGEISASVMLEYSNKVHHGFLGHSVLGSWTNLGAGTTNSNLKNNYSKISMMYFNDIITLDSIFMGLILGDHSKTAINTTINTGTVIGINTNIFGTGIPDKSLPSFIWGGISSYESFKLGKAKHIAKAVMSRRNIQFDKKMDKLFDDVYNYVQKTEY